MDFFFILCKASQHGKTTECTVAIGYEFQEVRGQKKEWSHKHVVSLAGTNTDNLGVFRRNGSGISIAVGFGLGMVVTSGKWTFYFK